MYCNWIMYFGDYCFKTDCGRIQGIDIRPNQKICFCGNKVIRFKQDSNGAIKQITRVKVHKGNACYYSD